MRLVFIIPKNPELLGAKRALPNSVKELSNVLRDVEDLKEDLTDDQIARLQNPTDSCRALIVDLEQLLDCSQELRKDGGKPGGRARRVWKRLEWDEKDVDDFRDRLNLAVNAFNLFLNSISR